MKQIIDFESWNRKDNFNFFKGFINPCISITSEVDCTDAKANSKTNGQSFFLYYLYAILRAVNEIDALRYRLTKKEEIVCYDKVDVLCPIRVPKTGNFFTVRIPWKENFDEFYETAYAIIHDIPEDGDPYGAENDATEDEKYNLILVSATPDLYFTSITHTQEHANGANYPLLNVGKAIMREGRLVMPVAIYVNHSFVDGIHLAEFYAKVTKYLGVL